MKLKNLASMFAIVAVAAIIFSGCKKELSQPISQNTENSDALSNEVNALADQADNAFLNSEITGGTETEAFSLVNDGLPDAYTITESTADELNGLKRNENLSDIAKCLRNLDLSKDQILKVKHLFREYEGCKRSIIIRYAHASRELLVKYNAKHDELVKALRNGRITKAQFAEKMKELRKMYEAEKSGLAMKARAALKDCYTHMLRGLNGVLNERQWKAFINCYQH